VGIVGAVHEAAEHGGDRHEQDATSIACRILAPMKDALGSGVPCARLSMPSSRWKVTAAAMLLKHAVITEKEAMDAT